MEYPGSNVAIDLDERRRRRDQRLAVQAATEIVQEAARGRTISLEWAAVAALLASGVGLGLSAWYHHLPPRPFGEAVWAGLLFGALLSH
ncbi:MAG TPA: hypothetical protein VKU60_05640, partial [Chloroflexota bacterium]|nr:hypothetical protein [Chloroflexota bacterium]